MSWTIARRVASFDFDIIRDPIGGFATKHAACDEIVKLLERERRELARAMRKAKQMRRRSGGPGLVANPQNSCGNRATFCRGTGHAANGSGPNDEHRSEG